MSKAVLISIRPKWCQLIALGKKTLEIRKSTPNLPRPFKCYIYCTKGDKHSTLCIKDGNEYGCGKAFGYCTQDGNEYNCGKAFRKLYCGKVIGEFICDNIVNTFSDSGFWVQDNVVNGSCLSPAKIRIYANGRKLYAWHISNLVIYDNPKELSEFGLKRPPQSWCYVKELEE